MADSVWRLPFEGTNVAVLADCHIRRDGPQFPAALFPRLQGADVIVTLGDMGARAGLDQLEQIAPVMGVRGEDDDDDLRTGRAVLVLEGEGYKVGCVFDAKAAGLAAAVDPFVPTEQAMDVCRQLFGSPVNILLHAGTHRADEASFGGGSALNPGSAVLPAEGRQTQLLAPQGGPGGLLRAGDLGRLAPGGRRHRSLRVVSAQTGACRKRLPIASAPRNGAKVWK